MDKKAIPTDPKEYAKAVEKVKARVARWPNAYASGQVVVEYKRAMAEKGKPAYENTVSRGATALRRWYRENWIDIRTGEKCGNQTAKAYPTCRPEKRITSLTPVTAAELKPSQKKHMIELKQKAKKKTVHYKETKAVRQQAAHTK